MRKSVLPLFALAFLIAPLANADDLTDAINTARAQGHSVRAITPIFSQLLLLSFPKGFKPAFENSKGASYIQEAVLEGETVEAWSQMITVTGAKGLADNPNVNPQGFLGSIAGGFKKACQETFSAVALGPQKISGHDGFAGLISCGSVQSGASKHSETALILAIKGSTDYYTVQWAERAAPSDKPLAPDTQQWAAKFKQLTPIKLCPIVPGEKAPYPSCVEQK